MINIIFEGDLLIMFCPKCGAQLGESTVCSNCGFNVNEVNTASNDSIPKVEETSLNTIAEERAKRKIMIKLIVFSVLAVVVLVMFLMAASKISESGLNILGIQSVGGKTLEEAYYFELGNIYAGYAMIARALGIFFASTLVWLGLKK